MKKGESLRDTVQTIEAMGIDAVVMRHPAAGAPNRVAGWIDASVINAGDGCHEHPTQALLDCLTLRRHLGPDARRRCASPSSATSSTRVSRAATCSPIAALGADVTLVAPPTLLPPYLDGWPVAVSHDLDAVLDDVDVVSLLRIQHERRNASLFPSLREYTARYGLTVERAARLRKDTLVMHPGPMNRGVEIAAEVAEGPASLITEQVTNGVAVRMACLYSLLGSGEL